METVSRHFQESHFPGFTMTGTFAHKGTRCPLVIGTNPTVTLSSLISTSEPDLKMCYLPLKSIYAAYHSDPFSVRCRGIHLDWLLLVEVSKRTRLLLLVHHKEKWRKHLEREGTEQSILAVITLKAADISCCHTSWSAGAGTCQILPRIVKLSFIKRKWGLMQLEGIKPLKCYFFFLFWTVI